VAWLINLTLFISSDSALRIACCVLIASTSIIQCWKEAFRCLLNTICPLVCQFFFPYNVSSVFSLSTSSTSSVYYAFISSFFAASICLLCFGDFSLLLSSTVLSTIEALHHCSKESICLVALVPRIDHEQQCQTLAMKLK